MSPVQSIQTLWLFLHPYTSPLKVNSTQIREDEIFPELYLSQSQKINPKSDIALEIDGCLCNFELHTHQHIFPGLLASIVFFQRNEIREKEKINLHQYKCKYM